MKNIGIMAGASVIALIAGQAAAQDAFVLDEIVVDGGILPSEASRTGATVEVVDGDELSDLSLDTATALDALPGVSFSSNGGLGTTSGLRIRGLGSSYIGVTVDGIDITDPAGTQTGFDFGTFITPGVDRITVLKGPQSAVAGASAVGGSVDITTWRPEELGFSGEARAEAGSFDTYLGSVSLGYLDAQTELAFTLTNVSTEGFSARDSDTEADGFDQVGMNLSVSHRFSDTVLLGFSAFRYDGVAEFDRSTSDETGELDKVQTGARIFAEFDAGGIVHELAYSRSETDRLDPGAFTFSFLGEREKLEYKGTAELGNATLAFGGDWIEESALVLDTLSTTDSDITKAGLFGEVQYRASDDLDLAFTLRYDDHSEFGGQLSGRAALAWQVGDDVTIRAAAGTGYRPPSLNELFGPFGANPNLTPEQARGLELGVERRFDRGFARATLFYNEIDDLITFSGGYVQLPGTTVTQGVELSGEYMVSDRVTLFGTYTFTDAATEDAGLVRVPRHDALLGVSADITDALSGSVSVQHISDLLDFTAFPDTGPLDDYTLANASISYDVTDRVEAYARVENLFDEQYQTVRGYNASDRAVYVGLRAAF